MSIVSRSILTEGTNSLETGKEAGRSLLEGFETPVKLVIVYLTDNHDQPSFLKGLREELGEAQRIFEKI